MKQDDKETMSMAIRTLADAMVLGEGRVQVKILPSFLQEVALHLELLEEILDEEEFTNEYFNQLLAERAELQEEITRLRRIIADQFIADREYADAMSTSYPHDHAEVVFKDSWKSAWKAFTDEGTALTKFTSDSYESDQ